MNKRDVEIYFHTKVKDVSGQSYTMLDILRIKEKCFEENMFEHEYLETCPFNQ